MSFDFRDILITIIGAICFALILVTFAGCKITKQSKTDYTYTGSGYEHTEHIRDTVYIEKTVVATDSTTAEKEQTTQTDVTFTPAGGSYNIFTGQMQGVTSLSISERERILQNEVNTLRAVSNEQRARISAQSDSLQNIKEQLSASEDVETKAQNFWLVFLITGFVVGTGTVIALKKIPYTKPFMVWL